MNQPLVSILVPNYNNAKYLERCYESILNQTYPNIEVISYDNQSTDGSYSIMLQYKEKFRERGLWMDVGMNKRNVGSAKNVADCYGKSEGSLLMFLSSDDAIKPTFVERCVNILEEYTNVGMVMVHRDEMDEMGDLRKVPPFYNQSCIIPGEAQASVFMMAGIAVPSQVLMRRVIADHTMRKPIVLQIANDWLDNFLVSCLSDIAYIKDALCEYRIHTENDTSASEENLVGIFEHYQLINAFLWIGESYGYRRHLCRYESAVKKLGSMCFRYAYKMLQCGKKDIAKKYLYLIPVFDEELLEDPLYELFSGCCRSEGEQFQKAMKQLECVFQKQRTCSYDPPEGAISLEL